MGLTESEARNGGNGEGAIYKRSGLRCAETMQKENNQVTNRTELCYTFMAAHTSLAAWTSTGIKCNATPANWRHEYSHGKKTTMQNELPS